MVPPAELLSPGRETELVRADGRPKPDFRAQLRRIPSWRNAWSVVFLYVQTGAIIWATVAVGPWLWPVGFVPMGRAHTQFASLMHEAAHRLLFANRRINDFVGRWLLGYPAFVSTDAYRRVHMAHHRQEFGPDEPDIPLYVGYPVGPASFRRKLIRDATGRTGLRLLRQQFAGVRSPNIGWHLAHHVDSGVPFRNLPRYHRAMAEAGYVTDPLEYRSYPAIWRALAGGSLLSAS